MTKESLNIGPPQAPDGEEKRTYSDEYKRLWVQFACAVGPDSECDATHVYADNLMNKYEQRFGKV